MGLFARSRVPLTPPLPLSEGYRLGDDRFLIRGKRAGELHRFIEAVTERVHSGALDDSARDLAGTLLSAIADEASEHLTRVLDDLAPWTRIGLAAAEQEVAMGWARPGYQDSCVATFFSWPVFRSVPKEDDALAELAFFAAEGAYYYSRAGDGALPVLRELLVRTGLRIGRPPP